MFDSKGSQLRYRQKLPFEEAPYQLTPANLHLNIFRPRRTPRNNNTINPPDTSFSQKSDNAKGQVRTASEMRGAKATHYYSANFRKQKPTEAQFTDPNRLKLSSTSYPKRTSYNMNKSVPPTPPLNQRSPSQQGGQAAHTQVSFDGSGNKNMSGSISNQIDGNKHNDSYSSLLSFDLPKENPLKLTNIISHPAKPLNRKLQLTTLTSPVNTTNTLCENNKPNTQKAQGVTKTINVGGGHVLAAECFKGRRPYNEDRYICLTNCGSFRDKIKFAINGNADSVLQRHERSLNKVRIRQLSSNISPLNNTIEQATDKTKDGSKVLKYDLYGVFDGHGGSKCSEFIKENVSQLLSVNKNVFNNPPTALRETIHRLEEKFISMCQKQGTLDMSGSCAVLLMLADRIAHVANVGDCRALILNHIEIKQITKDHKPDDPVEKMRIIKNGGKLYRDGPYIKGGDTGKVKMFSQTRINPGSLNVSRTIGDIQSKLKKYGGAPGVISPEPDMFVQPIAGYSCIILASDGLFQGLTNEQVHNIYVEWDTARRPINSSPTQQQANTLAKQLVSRAAVKSTDNITVVCVLLEKQQE